MKLYESLFILTRTYDNITYMSEIMWDNGLVTKDVFEDEEKKTFHYLALFSHIILETCSFLEEYNLHFYSVSEEKYKERIKQLKTHAKPVLRQISKWKGLKDYRNHMIAHPWRRGSSSEFSFKYLFSYEIPTGYLELQLMLQYLRMILVLIEKEFEAELLEVPSYMTSIQHLPRKPLWIGNWLEEMQVTVDLVNTELEKSEKKFRLDCKAFIGDLENEKGRLK